MKKYYILSPLAIFFGLLVFISASEGVGQEQNKDRTGSPAMGSGSSDGVCTNCHKSGINFGTIPTMTLNDDNGAVTSYVPGTTYKLKLAITDNGSSGHGFQITGLFDNNAAAGICTPITSNTQKSIVNNRWYFEQSKSLTDGLYELSWIAPPANSGKVTFYGSALAVNADSKTSGDQFVKIPTLVISESSANAITDVTPRLKLDLFPNPASEYITIENGNNELMEVNIYSISGELVVIHKSTDNKLSIPIGQLNPGTYLVSSFGLSGLRTSKFMKQ
jgi:hypothetical protein